MSRRAALWSLLAIVVLSMAVYAPTLGNDYTLDDNLLARPVQADGRPNTMVAELRPLGDYFAANYWAGYGKESHLYRPLTILGYALTNAVQSGVDPRTQDSARLHHLLNVLLHGWAVVCAFRLTRRYTKRDLPALVAGMVFGLHAIHSEVVAGIVGRAELLGFTCGAEAVLLYLGAERARGIGRAACWVGAALLLFAAFASKENALAWVAFLPLCALAADRVDGSMLSARRVLVHLARTAAVAGPPLALFLVLRARALADMPEQDFVNWLSNPLYFTDAATRICSAVAIWGYGLWLSLWPFHLVSDYGPVTFPLLSTPWHQSVALSVLAILAWLVAGVLWARRAPLLFLAMSCFLGFSFLTSNVPLAVGTVFGERLYYTPSLGIAFLAAWLWTVAGRARPAYAIALALWLVASGVVILERNRAWHDDLTLLETDVRENPRSVRLLDTAASIASNRGDLARAEALWKDALALDPDYADAMSNYAAALGMRGRYAEAEQLLVRALAAPAQKRQRPESIHTNLGLLYEATGRTDAAWEQLVQAFRIAPTAAGVHQPLLRVAEARRKSGQRADIDPVLTAMANDARLPDNVRRHARSLLLK